MVIEYLQQIKDSYFEQKHALEKQLNLLEIQLKENTGMIKMLEDRHLPHRDRMQIDDAEDTIVFFL